MVAKRQLKMELSNAVKMALMHAGAFHASRALRPNHQAAILRYHAVVDEHENFYTSPGISISVKDFEKHVAFFSRYYTILRLDQVIDAIQHGRSFPPNSIVFTFDDGYADNYIAAKILKKYDATGMFYLTTDCIDRKEPLWLVEVNYLLEYANVPEIMLELKGREIRLPLYSSEDRSKAKRQVVRMIKSNDRQIRARIREQLRNQAGIRGWREKVERVMLTWHEVHEMIDDGMEIGGHTLSHLNLPNAGLQDAKYEIEGCRTVLEEKLGRQIRHFSVPNSGPYHYYNSEIETIVKACGFESTVTSAQGFVSNRSPLHRISRIRTVPDLHEVVASIELGKLLNSAN